MPSMVTKKNTVATLAPSQPSVSGSTAPLPLSNNPVALSSPRIMSTASWMIAGMARYLEGKAGIPKDIEERERNTADW